MENKISFWQALFYLSWSILALWLILKVTGMIRTPVWLEYGVPIGSFMVGILALYKNILKDISGIAIGLATVTVRVDHIAGDVGKLDMKVSNLTAGFNKLDAKMNHLDHDMHLVKRKIGADF